MSDVSVLATLVDALAEAHTPRRVVEVARAVLHPALDVRDVSVWWATGGNRGRRISAGDGRSEEVEDVERPSECCGVDDGTTVRTRSGIVVALPARGGFLLLGGGFEAASARVELDLLRALASIVSASLRHAEVLGRVALLSKNAHRDVVALRRKLDAAERADGLVVASPAMLAIVRDFLPAVARHDSPVLLRGETGTGKDVLARRIHALSRRSTRAFVGINCGAIPESIVESTLFGHERGAFTGATDRVAGVFERAHEGTLFLDEIGDLPLAAQVKLLRVLESGRVERIGGVRPIPAHARVIAATNRPLEEMVTAGTFRADLFYRLSVLPLEIPPLRERPEDLDVLVTAFVARAAAAAGREKPLGVPARVREKLRAHSWPGNVRELANVIERAVLLSRGSELELPFALYAPRVAGGSSLDETTRGAIERALEASRGRIYGPGGAAVKLGLRPTTLQSKMSKLGIERRRA